MTDSVSKMVSQMTKFFVKQKEEVLMKALNYHQVNTEDIQTRAKAEIYLSEGIERIYIDGVLVITFKNTNNDLSKGLFISFQYQEHYKTSNDIESANIDKSGLNEKISVALYELELLHKKIAPSPNSNIDRHFKTISELLK